MEIFGSGSSAEACVLFPDNQTTQPSKRKRNLPGMPDPDAEVIALTPKSLLATNQFVCEICNKGFQRDQNLQLHLRCHNLPWKLPQRNSNEVRKKVYICPEQTCGHHNPARALGDLTGIKKHFCRKHGVKKWKCDRCSKKYAVQSDWKAHMKTCGTREYRCDCGTLLSRRDSYVTHRAFCDALAKESAKSQTLAITNSEETLKVQAVTTSSFRPPPPPLTPSTGVLSPVVSTNTVSGGSSTSSGNINTSSGVFASIFASPSSAGLSQSSQSPSSYSDFLGATAGSEEPMSLSLSSSFCLTNNTPSLVTTTDQDHLRRYTLSPQPALSATALLQKAAQMGSTVSNSSFLRSLGLTMSSASDHQDNTSTTTTTWNSQVKSENNLVASGFGLGRHSNEPTTLDLLGLGLGAGGAPSSGLSAHFHGRRH